MDVLTTTTAHYDTTDVDTAAHYDSCVDNGSRIGWLCRHGEVLPNTTELPMFETPVYHDIAPYYAVSPLTHRLSPLPLRLTNHV